MTSYQSKAGYWGGMAYLCLAFLDYQFAFGKILIPYINLNKQEILLSNFLLVFIVMLLVEWYAISKYKKKHQLVTRFYKNKQPNLLLLKSVLIRFLVILMVIVVGHSLVQHHYYFNNNGFDITRLFFDYLLYLYCIIGLPYMWLTLKYRGEARYEYNDYALLTLSGIKGVVFCLGGLLLFNPVLYQRGKRRLGNKRVIKVWLVFLVNFFFLTLMTKFYFNEYSGFERAWYKINTNFFDYLSFFDQFKTWYLLLFHLIFVIDVGIAIIGYTFASRWLNNRTKSVDMTFYGWLVVLLCYPPMNAGFTEQFIGYGKIATHEVITAEWAQMVIMCLILCSFSIYMWATLALGFKFSNLTNRGIVTLGPYRFFRHPAYASKNFAWWLDNTHLLSNIWAAIALLIWNIIYILRGLTEEKHLLADLRYQQYVKQVRNRFIPSLFKKHPDE